MNSNNENLVFKTENINVIAIFIITLTGQFSQGAAIILCLIFSTFILMNTNKILLNSKVVALFNFLLITLVFGIINNSGLINFAEEGLRNIAYLLFFAVLVNSTKTENIDIFFRYFTKLVLISVIMFPVLQYHDRFSSFFSHPNHLAYACNLLIAYYLVCTDKTKHNLITILLLYIVVILSASSGGLICSTLTILLYAFRKNLLVFMLMTIFISSLVWLLKDVHAISFIFDKFSSVKIDEIEYRSAHLAFGNDTSLVWRVTYWYAIIDNFMKYSTFTQWFGLGIGTMSYPDYYFFWMITDPHNDYVRKIAEIGFLGAIFYFINWIFILRKVKYSYYFISVFFVPMVVGNMIVSVTFLFMLLLLIARFERIES